MGILDILFPRRCLGCGSLGSYFCPRCRATIKFINTSRYPPGLDGLTSFFSYEGIIKKAIKTIKYRHISDLASEFVSLLPGLEIPPVDILVPIPLHPSRLRERGFNQAEVLGKLLAEKLHIVMRTDILKRTKKTPPQVEMKDRNKRLANMENVFRINNSLFVLHNSRILLFDDVFTTGATMTSAAHVLRRAGVKFIWGMTMAR